MKFGLFAIVASAALITLAYWFEGLWPLAFVMVLPLFFVWDWIFQKNYLSVFFLGMLLGTLLFLGGMPLFMTGFLMSGFGSGILSAISLSGIFFFSAVIFIYGMLFGVLFVSLKLLSRRCLPVTLTAFIFPALWVSVELIIRELTFGFDWWFVGMPLASSSVFRQLAAFGGAPMLSWFAIFVNGSIVFLLKRDGDGPRQFSLKAVLMLLPIAGALYGTISYLLVDVSRPSAWPKIALLQTNQKYPRRFPVLDDSAYGPLIREALMNNSGIIVFPGQIAERPVVKEILSTTFLKSVLGEELLNSETTLIFYIPVYEGRDKIYQTMLAVRGGKVIGQYRKEILFPVSDYLPQGPIRFIISKPPEYSLTPYRKISTEDANGILTPDGLLGAAICNEPFSANFERRVISQRTPIFIVTGSDDAFFSPLISKITLRAAQMRAAEGRKWILRVYKTGISAVIAPNGDVVAKLDRNVRGMINFGHGDINVYTAP